MLPATSFAPGAKRSAELVWEGPADQLAQIAERLVGDGQRVLTLVGTDERASKRGFGLWLALLAPDGSITQLRASVDPANPRYPAMTPRVPAVHWDEREVADMFGLVPEGHPDPRRLILREDWPSDLHPLRKDFDPSRVPPPPRHDAYPFMPLHGEELGHVPVGPIHAGIIEPGHFRFVAVGETVLELEARLFYTHRGIEKLVEGRTPDAALPLVERICAACAFSHQLAFARAVEAIAAVEVPPRAAWARVLCLELERLYNHVGDSGNICAGTGFAVGSMRGARLKEQIQRAIETLVGHRFLRDVCTTGGLRRDLTPDGLAALRSALPKLWAETRRFADLVLGTDSFIARAQGTGILGADVVRALGGVGVAARASGVDIDLRRDLANSGYAALPLRVPIHHAGDAEARLRQRLAEADVSWDLVATLLDREPGGMVRLPVGPLPAQRVGIGAVESPRGANVHWLLTDTNGRVDRLRVRSASFANWPVVPAAVPGNLMPDFPLINKSFELCYACLDR